MNSAFGVDHGEVSKSFKKLQPKLLAASRRNGPYAKFRDGKKDKTQTMANRARLNYAVYRNQAGNQAEFGQRAAAKGQLHGTWDDGFGGTLEDARDSKRIAHANVTAAGNISRREGRFLP